MRIFVMAVGIFILLLVKDVFAKTDLSKLAGKQIYRDVPAKNETAYDESYQGNVYRLICYSEYIMEIKSIGFQGKNGEIFGESVHVLRRDFWDDGNWKEWSKRTQIEKLIGKKIYRIKKCGVDRSYMDGPRELLDIDDDNLIISPGIIYEDSVKLPRNFWDDGNWKEWGEKQRRLVCVERTGVEVVHSVEDSQYRCVKCGRTLKVGMGSDNYYCVKCKIAFNIEEK